MVRMSLSVWLRKFLAKKALFNALKPSRIFTEGLVTKRTNWHNLLHNKNYASYFFN